MALSVPTETGPLWCVSCDFSDVRAELNRRCVVGRSLIVHKITVFTPFGAEMVATSVDERRPGPLNSRFRALPVSIWVCHQRMALCHICRKLRISLNSLLPSASTVVMVKFAVQTLSTTKTETFMTYIILIGALLAVAVLFMAMDEKSY